MSAKIKNTNTKVLFIIDKDEKESFYAACKKNGITPSKAIREFIKSYLKNGN